MNLANTTQDTLGLMKESLAKNVTISTGLTAYDLQAPAKNLFPIVTPLAQFAAARRAAQSRRRGALARRSPRSPAPASTRWAGFRKASARRACPIPRHLVTAPYLTLGEEDTVTFEAEAAAQGFEDINATATLRLLQKTMRKEEMALLGGNASLALGNAGRADAQRRRPRARRCRPRPIRSSSSR